MKTHKLKSLPENKNAVLIGRGRLTWNRHERVSDRYGTVYLMEKSGDAPTKIHVPSGSGKILAVVTDAIQSTHIGDFFRGLSPRTPTNGDILVIGNGEAFSEMQVGIKTIGVKPADGRESDWLNPRALYDCHESMVELIWIPA